MSLSDEQKQIIATKLAEGASIADIQKLVNDEFKTPMTYMDTRFLIDDLNLDIVDNTPKEEEVEDQTSAPAEAELIDEVGGGASGVSVEVDRIKTPGAALSGTVKFSDGQNATWTVDPYGRLGLDPDQEGYQPEPEDIEAFQIELQKQIQGPGM
ncbi:MAG: hypothetical protein AAGB46_12795 [Verrucomicrobiota bacterium]